jgi:hypothetical protein
MVDRLLSEVEGVWLLLDTVMGNDGFLDSTRHDQVRARPAQPTL